MMSLTFGLFTQVSGSGPLGPLVIDNYKLFKLLMQNSLLKNASCITAPDKRGY